MEFKVISHTIDLSGSLTDFNRSEAYSCTDMITLGGREAGICYMAEDYFDSKINNTELAQDRAETIVKTGHHSPFDHGTIGLQISGIPKIMAMILNSTEFYTTSEKSARYTVMKPDTDRELEIYNKWRNTFKTLILNLGEKISDREADKLALENARYMLSVFTPTSMGFTTTFRQFSYLAEWLERLVSDLQSNPNKFNLRLIPYCIELSEYFKDLTANFVKDNKDGRIQLLRLQSGFGDIPKAEFFSEMYQTNYLGSFAQLAQAQRHRTIHYEMQFSGDIPGEFGCYIPKIIQGTPFEKEWTDDFTEMSEYFPQCTLVKVLEQGRAYWFFKKAHERLCGRAQLEIADRTKITMQKFMGTYDMQSDYVRGQISRFMPDGQVVLPKCGTPGYTCKEPCRWGRTRGVDRII